MKNQNLYKLGFGVKLSWRLILDSNFDSSYEANFNFGFGFFSFFQNLELVV
jgi:hypothetical protein